MTLLYPNLCYNEVLRCVIETAPYIIWAWTRENLSGVCEQHRSRPACAFAQSDQRLCYSFFGKCHI